MFNSVWFSVYSCEIRVETDLLTKLGNKEVTKVELAQMVESNFDLLPTLLDSISSSRATIRYGCGKVLMDLSEKYPKKLYPYMEFFIGLLDSKYRILKWNAMAIIANLTIVDEDRKFDAIFDKYYSYLSDEYMVTVANVVGNSAKIALAKPYLAQRITIQLLKVKDIKVTPHLTKECKLVITEQTIKTFDAFFGHIEDKEQVIAFAKKQLDSSRTSLREEAQIFLRRRQ